MGETCGLKLVYETRSEGDICKLCHDMEKKQRRYDKMYRDVQRWQREGGRPATVERTCGEMQEVLGQIYRLNDEHNQRLQSLGQVRSGTQPSKKSRRQQSTTNGIYTVMWSAEAAHRTRGHCSFGRKGQPE